MPFDIEFMLESLTNVPINSHEKKPVNEDPDGVYGGSDNGDSLNWSDGDNVAFICTDKYSIIGPGLTHWDILHALIKSYKQNDEYFDRLDAEGASVSDMDALVTDVFTAQGLLHQHIIKYITTDGRPGENFRSDIDGLLTGRLWRDSEIISFWNDQHSVLHNWESVEKMFSDFRQRLGSLWDYSVDWVERNDENIPLTPASDISRSPKIEPKTQSDYENEPEVDERGQLNFFAKLFKNPMILNKLNTDQLKKIRDKVHVLDPQVKAQVMKAVGGEIKNKAAMIADKLGMSVAEFNSLWHLDEVVNESPDSFVMNKKQRAMFAAQGFHRPEDLSKVAYYDRSDAVAFLIGLTSGVTIYNPPGMGELRLTHPDMGSMVMGYLAYPNDYDKFPVKNGKGYGIDLKPDIEPPPGNDIGPVAVLQASGLPDMVNKLKSLAKTLPLDGDVPRKDQKFIQGRLWLRPKAISFWGTREFVLKHFDRINELLIGLNLRKEEMVYEFLDSGHLYTYAELTGKSVEMRSKEEMDRLMAMQHLDPKAKKKLAAMQNNLKQKGVAGWDFMAQKHAALPALQETPDNVRTFGDEEKKLVAAGIDISDGAHWKDIDAITFIFDVPEKRILWIDAAEVVVANEKYAGRPNHAALIRQIAYYRHYPQNFEIVADDKAGLILNTKEGAPQDKVWFTGKGVHGTGFTNREDFDAYLALADWSKKVEREALPKSLILGRFWRKSNVISYWQPKSKVLKEFSMTEQLLKLFGVAKEKVGYEFIDIKKIFTYDELFQEDDEKYKVSSSEMADLLKKQHTDPSAKKRLKDLGYYDKQSQKGFGGFDFKAQRDAALPALQEIVKKLNISK